jgi:hypothetical protein
MPSGRKPNTERRKQVFALRAQGLSLRAIGKRLGVSHECVRDCLWPKYQKQCFRVRCRLCDSDINPAGALPRDDRAVLCLHCLAKQPHVSFGEHLLAYRLAAGLKINVLAERAGIAATQISRYESGRDAGLKWATALRLLRTLGVQMVLPESAYVRPSALLKIGS